MDCHFLLQGLFPIQESNPGLLHCRQTLYHLSHQGSATIHFRLGLTSLWHRPSVEISFCLDCHRLATDEGGLPRYSNLSSISALPQVLIFFPLGLYFLLLSFESSLYILGGKSFIDYVIWKYFLPAYTCLFILFTLSFTEQTFLFQ